MSKIGKNIRKIRTTKGLNQTAFGAIFNLTRGSIGSYEEGRAEPKIDTLIQIANYFGITLDDITTKDITVNQLSRFNPEVLTTKKSAKQEIQKQNKPFLSSSELVKCKGQYEAFDKRDSIEFPVADDHIAFFMKVDEKIHLAGVEVEQGAVLICGKSSHQFSNNWGRVYLSDNQLLWDVESERQTPISFPVYGIMSSTFKRKQENLDSKIHVIENRLQALEQKLNQS